MTFVARDDVLYLHQLLLKLSDLVRLKEHMTVTNFVPNLTAIAHVWTGEEKSL